MWQASGIQDLFLLTSSSSSSDVAASSSSSSWLALARVAEADPAIGDVVAEVSKVCVQVCM